MQNTYNTKINTTRGEIHIDENMLVFFFKKTDDELLYWNN
jgi:hypothetical protein